MEYQLVYCGFPAIANNRDWFNISLQQASACLPSIVGAACFLSPNQCIYIHIYIYTCLRVRPEHLPNNTCLPHHIISSRQTLVPPGLVV
jgi:hypothetical protein